MIPWNPHALVIGPGGTRAYYYLGALRALSENQLLNDIHTWVGVSAGALVSVLLAAGFTADQLYDESISTDLFSLVQVNTFQSILASWGLMSTLPLEQRLTILLKAKLGTVPSFRELYNLTGQTVIVVASDLDARTPLYFSHETTPEVSVVEAVVASCTVPLLFSQRTYSGHRVIDGAFTDPYPLHLGARKTNTLGLVMIPSENTDAIEPYPIASYTLPIHQLKMLSIEMWSESPTVYHLPIYTPMLTMDLFTDEQKREMVDIGYVTAKTHIVQKE
jgi:NTE family protein